MIDKALHLTGNGYVGLTRSEALDLLLAALAIAGTFPRSPLNYVLDAI